MKSILAKRFDDFSIRNRIILLVAASTFFFMVFFLFSTLVAERSVGNIERVGNSALPMVTRLHRVDYQFLLLRDTYQEAIADQDDAALADAGRLAARLGAELTALAEREPRAADAAVSFDVYARQADRLARASVSGSVLPEQLYVAISAIKAREDEFRERFGAFRNFYLGQVSGWVEQAHRDSRNMRIAGLALGGVALACILLLGGWIVRSVRSGLQEAVDVAQEIASGNWDLPVPALRRDETGQLLGAIHRMRVALQERQAADRRREARTTFLAQLDEHMRGQLTPQQLSRNVLDYLAGVLQAPVGVLYVLDRSGETLVATATHALHTPPLPLRLGQGLTGQAAAERRFMEVDNVPEDYFTIRCGLMELRPRQLVLAPLVHNGQLVGLLELGFAKACDEAGRRLLQDSARGVAISLVAALAWSPLE